MKHIALLLAISFVASGAQAAEYGLGASLGSFSDTQEIFVPIQVLSPTGTLEPPCDRHVGASRRSA
jgi:hypothetical protein